MFAVSRKQEETAYNFHILLFRGKGGVRVVKKQKIIEIDSLHITDSRLEQQWWSGSALYLLSKGSGFEPGSRHFDFRDMVSCFPVAIRVC